MEGQGNLLKVQILMQQGCMGPEIPTPNQPSGDTVDHKAPIPHLSLLFGKGSPCLEGRGLSP